jgi:hypothetical protein
VYDADISYLYAIVDRSETNGKLFSHFNFEVNFQWNNITLRKSFTGFNLIVQLVSSGFEGGISELRALDALPLWTSKANMSRLFVPLPNVGG